MVLLERRELSCGTTWHATRLVGQLRSSRREVPEAREILRNLIAGRIVFMPRPEDRVYEFSGRGRWGGCWPDGPSSFGGDPGGSPAILYSVQDVPLLRALGFDRVDA